MKSQIKVTQSDRPKNKKVIQAELGSDATKQFFSKRREFTAHNFDFFEINILNKGNGQLLAGQLLVGQLRADTCSLGQLLARTVAR